MQTKYSWFFLFVVLWSACSKTDFPPDEPGDPVFTAQFLLETEEHTLVAGQDSVYLFTDYRPGNDEVLVLSGSFAAVNCPAGDCPGSLTFQFRNDHTGSGVSPDTLFFPGNRAYFNAMPTVIVTSRRTTFSTSDTLDYQGFQWIIDNGTPVPGKSIVLDFPDDTPHQVSLRAFRSGAIGSIVSRTIVADTLDNTYPAVSIMVTDSTSGGPFQLFANTLGTSVTSFAWNTGDSAQQISVSQLDANYAVSVKNAAGDTAYAVIVTNSPVIPLSNTANFDFEVENVLASSDSLQLGSVLIRWVDENNTVWESFHAGQPTTSYFQILSSEGYDLNENGQKTYKMNVAFSCMLYHTDNPSLSRSISGTAVIAVAYP